MLPPPLRKHCDAIFLECRESCSASRSLPIQQKKTRFELPQRGTERERAGFKDRTSICFLPRLAREMIFPPSLFFSFSLFIFLSQKPLLLLTRLFSAFLVHRPLSEASEMAQQQQLEKRRQPLTLPQPSDLAAAIGRDWREPKKLQLAFDSWVKQQHPVIEVLTATIAGSGQVIGIWGRRGQSANARAREKQKKKRTGKKQKPMPTAACCRRRRLPRLLSVDTPAFSAPVFSMQRR